ncbi:hypothetical protein DFR24_3240 [Panacagrimonas perspica]|uniref:Lipoprotein n=1 Tax=Panacagrimonas perspica TaxID=381431 RepID=A0A4V3URC3_9GAMM|nr:hypothetical protein [Panacagrimonas perspica]TDU28860.1 hypothetical protein DFR24_3240 [Panacagrimonas perspica]THD02311.1 hypothetical protein B1810_15405 [Panacagrimonas perspica]
MKTAIAAIFAATCALSACTPQATQKPAAEVLPQKWVADLSKDECLSNGDSAARLSPFAISAITKVADWALSAAVDKVQEAAEKDRIGFSQAFVDGSFLYYRAGSNAPQTATCIRIAHGTALKRDANGESPDDDWCQGIAGASDLCKGLRPEKASAVKDLGKRLGISSPDFYAEIQLENRDNATATRGTVAYLYYPAVLPRVES